MIQKLGERSPLHQQMKKNYLRLAMEMRPIQITDVYPMHVIQLTHQNRQRLELILPVHLFYIRYHLHRLTRQLLMHLKVDFLGSFPLEDQLVQV